MLRNYHGHLSGVYCQPSHSNTELVTPFCAPLTNSLNHSLRHSLINSFTLQVIRNYHGHLSGVYCMALHPTLDLIMTGGRDSTCRVWDMRTKLQVIRRSYMVL